MGCKLVDDIISRKNHPSVVTESENISPGKYKETTHNP